MPGLMLVPPEDARRAPPWDTVAWFNVADPLSLASLRGRVVALHAFQMLCPGCVAHGLPQAQRIAATFSQEEVAVVGLHTVFEHHAAMQPEALKAFLHEYLVTFPVGVDAPGSESPVPRTMAAYGLAGTPSLVLIDPSGRVRLHSFGRPDDMAVGAAIASLLRETQGVPVAVEDDSTPSGGCNADACRISSSA